MMDFHGRIVTDHGVMLGKPIIKGTRITVEAVLTKLADGMTIEDIIIAYPHVTSEDIKAAIAYSADVVSREEILAG